MKGINIWEGKGSWPGLRHRTNWHQSLLYGMSTWKGIVGCYNQKGSLISTCQDCVTDEETEAKQVKSHPAPGLTLKPSTVTFITLCPPAGTLPHQQAFLSSKHPQDGRPRGSLPETVHKSQPGKPIDRRQEVCWPRVTRKGIIPQISGFCQGPLYNMSLSLLSLSHYRILLCTPATSWLIFLQSPPASTTGCPT